MSSTDFIPEGLRRAGRKLLAAAGLLEFFRSARERMDREIFNWKQNRLTQDEVDAIYRLKYHDNANYGPRVQADSGWEPDSVMKAAQAKAVMAVLPGVKKVLVGGCSSGMAVAAFRNIGVDAWGYDVSPDLEKMVIPEVKAYVRRGSMLSMPYTRQDGFDCLLTTDVLEHIQLKNIDRLLSELRRLEFHWMAHIINHTSIQPDHMTLKPLSWWEAKFRGQYNLRKDLHAMDTGNPRIYGLNGDPRHVFTFWEKRA